jgi:L-ascorbate metabolism protein UlaG (beta-lactamase superfamily)
MSAPDLRLTYIGGPTALLELGGLRLLTDPTFDPAGAEFRSGSYVLQKTQAPALDPHSLGPVDAVLLSHDHHFDNLDNEGRHVLGRAGKVLTTEAGAARLGGRSVGLAPWQSVEIPTLDRGVLRVTATPARHGPANGDRGPVIGFILAFADQPQRALYISGDSVWYEGMAEVARRFSVRLALLFMGAARVASVGPANLTLTGAEAVEAARAFADAQIVPLHFEGWAHFSESRQEVEQAFDAAGLGPRLLWLEPGVRTQLSLG